MRPMDSPATIDEQLRMFGQNLRRARKRTGLAQDKLGIDKAMVSYLELGERSPRLTTVVRLGKLLGVTPAALLNGVGASKAGAILPPRRSDLERPLARFGANLLWARTREGVSQMELGGEARVDRGGISALEHGMRAPKMCTILKLAWTLEMPAAALLRGV
jgi:transcriptional regulator with XRE-family HTH domain